MSRGALQPVRVSLLVESCVLREPKARGCSRHTFVLQHWNRQRLRRSGTGSARLCSVEQVGGATPALCVEGGSDGDTAGNRRDGMAG